jgi:hypothetical protein
MLSPYKGMNLSCDSGYTSYNNHPRVIANVQWSGDSPQVRVRSYNENKLICDSGWITGIRATCNALTSKWYTQDSAVNISTFGIDASAHIYYTGYPGVGTPYSHFTNCSKVFPL